MIRNNTNIIPWRKDRITARWVAEHKTELSIPRRMNPILLAEACIYCDSIDNPFVEELLRRADLAEASRLSHSAAEKGKLLRDAATTFRIKLY